MRDPRRHAAPVALAISVLIAVGACAGTTGVRSVAIPEPGATSGSSAAAESQPAAESTPAATSGASPSGPPSAAPGVVLAQAWATTPLVDVSTGETFRIADHAGKVIIIESIAIWCSNCRAQQGDVQAALARLPADDVVYVVLDVDPNEDDDSLAAYRSQNGFQGRYAIAGGDVARALAADFGDQFTILRRPRCSWWARTAR